MSNFLKKLLPFLHKIRHTPIHPQCFAYRCERRRRKQVGQIAKGNLLDIGCGQQLLRNYLNPSTTYFSLDFPETGITLYNAKPSVFGDAESLPFKNKTFDTVILLEVLEHLPDPASAILEVKRVLKKDGVLILSTPFLYPIHDAPRDYQRWSKHGLNRLINFSGLEIRDFYIMGSPIETGILLFNLALAWQTIHSPVVARFPLLLLSVIVIPILNIFGITVSFLCKAPKNTPFAIGYLLIAQDSNK